MKVKQLIFLIITFSILSVISVFAANTAITLDSAVLEDKTITVTGSIQNPVSNQQITLMATDLLSGGGYNADGIFYINQTDALLDSEGAFKVSFNIDEMLDSDNIYIIRVGGTNIFNPAQMILTSLGGEGEVLLGDVNQDGKITASDAALTLQNVLYRLDYLTQKQIEAMKVTKSDIITSDNAANILAKALDSMYIFPVNQ